MAQNNDYILIVEDEPSIAALMERTLKPLPWRTVTAANGREALEILEAIRPNLIISDVEMPEISGIQLLRTIRQRGDDIPFLFVTGHADREVCLAALQLRATNLVEKPFRPIEFYAIVERLIAETVHNEAARARQTQLALIGEMCGIIAHEINNPLTIILGNVENLESSLENSNPDIQALAKIGHNIKTVAQRIGNITRGVRRLTGYAHPTSMEWVSLALIIENSIALSRLRAEKSAIEWIIDDIPRSLEVLCHAIQIEQVLLNLLNNAIYAVSAQETRWVRLEVEPFEPMIVISVTDSGPGLSSDSKKQIFSKCYSTKPTGDGSGLGLSICKKLMAENSGRIWLATDAAETRFCIQLNSRVTAPVEMAQNTRSIG
ncbi:response regulator [Bdellovibrionota bacterium FG-2]